MSFEFEDEPKPKRKKRFTWVHWLIFSFLGIFLICALTVLSIGGYYYFQTPTCH